MEVSSEDGMYAGLHQLAGNVVMVLDDVVGQQAVLLVEVGNQVVVHHGDDVLALLAGLSGLVDDPLQGFRLDASAIIIGVGTVAAGGKRVRLVHVAVDSDDDQALDGLAAVAQRGGIALGFLSIAVVAVDLGKLVTGDGCCRQGLVAIKTQGIRIVAVMITGDDQGLDAVGSHAVQVLCHALVAGTLTVVGEVTGDKHQPGLDVDHAVGKGSHDIIAHCHHLGVASVGLVDSATWDHKSGTEQVGIADNDDTLVVGTGCALKRE